MRAAAVRVLFVLLADAGPEGWCWRSPRELQAVLARSFLRQDYSLATILRSLHELRAAGFITWRTLGPGDAYPLRIGKGKASQVKWGQGRTTTTGGRVFMVDLDVLTAPACKSRERAASHEPPPMDDRTPPIIHDRPSDRLLVSSGDSESRTEEASLDPAPAALAEDTRPAGRADETRRDPPRERDPHALRAGTEGKRDPRLAVAPATTPRELGEHSAAPERHGGNEEHEPGHVLVHPITGAPMPVHFASEEKAAAFLELTRGQPTSSGSSVRRPDRRPPPAERPTPEQDVSRAFGQPPPRRWTPQVVHGSLFLGSSRGPGGPYNRKESEDT